MKQIQLILIGIMVFAMTCSSAYASSSQLSLSLSAKSDAALVSESEDVIVRFGLKNNGKAPVHVLKWAIPLTGLEGKLFNVTLDGEPVAYLGRIYKRPSPTDNDFFKMGASESLMKDVNLTSLYDFSRSGLYSITYRVAHPFKNDNGRKVAKGLVSETLKVWIDGRPTAKVEKAGSTEQQAVAAVTSYVSCSKTQQKKIDSALSAAQGMASESLAYLAGMSTSSVRYDTWFGTYSSRLWGGVYDNFAAISDALDNKPMTFDCSCTQNYFAYVYPNSPYNIYLCSVFWRVSTTGTDSKAGTIIHETSHFNVVAGTDDYVYGQTGAMQLADSSPNQATNNADNHEYFAENTPSLP
jgi:peptidyl-Lys metalloendopeptidase